jgi:hypothetical protein
VVQAIEQRPNHQQCQSGIVWFVIDSKVYQTLQYESEQILEGKARIPGWKKPNQIVEAVRK